MAGCKPGRKAIQKGVSGFIIGWTYCAVPVAMGSTHSRGINVDEVFSTVVCVETLHSLPVLATLEDCHTGLCSLCLSTACLRTREIGA